MATYGTNSGSKFTVASLMGGKSNAGAGPIPTQTFNSANFVGTTPPKVGSAQAGSKQGLPSLGSITPKKMVVVVLVIVGVGYLLHHFTFEEHLTL